MQHPTLWRNDEVKTIALGLRNAEDKSFAFPNYIMSEWLLLIIQLEGRFAIMEMVAYLSYLFSLRVPSETLLLQKADPSDQLTTFSPQPPKAIIGVGTVNQTPVLIIKFRFRGNIRGGCILAMHCLCAEARRAARRLCPVRGFWGAISDRFNLGDLIFGTLSANSANRQLKAIMGELGYLRAHK